MDRLASMLDYFLVQLAGPKCAELKVLCFFREYAQANTLSRYKIQKSTPSIQKRCWGDW